MNTVTIYQVSVTSGYMASECGTRYSLTPWGSDTEYYTGRDDGGREYVLPDGYTVAKTRLGDEAIYDMEDNECEITTHSSRRPQLVSLNSRRSFPVLHTCEEE